MQHLIGCTKLQNSTQKLMQSLKLHRLKVIENAPIMLILVARSPTESSVGKQDSTSSFENNGGQKDRETEHTGYSCPDSRKCCLQFYARFCIIDVSGTFIQLWPSNLLRHPGSRYCRCRSHLYHNSGVGFFLTSSSFITSYPSSLRSAGMYMQEALELVCRKRKLQNPKDYAHLLADRSILIPLIERSQACRGNESFY